MAQAAMLSAVVDATSVIDHVHLKQMTLGDYSLERELLQLFDRQAEMLIGRMRQSDASVLAPLAHTLKGSAISIGANEVASAAAAAERAAGGSADERRAAVDALSRAIDTTRAEIAVLLRV